MKYLSSKLNRPKYVEHDNIKYNNGHLLSKIIDPLASTVVLIGSNCFESENDNAHKMKELCQKRSILPPN